MSADIAPGLEKYSKINSGRALRTALAVIITTALMQFGTPSALAKVMEDDSSITPSRVEVDADLSEARGGVIHKKTNFNLSCPDGFWIVNADFNQNRFGFEEESGRAINRALGVRINSDLGPGQFTKLQTILCLSEGDNGQPVVTSNQEVELSITLH